VDALIRAINTANESSTTITTIHLEPDCVYELTDIFIWEYDLVYPAEFGLPEIVSHIIIDGQNATIARSDAPGTPDFSIFLVAASGDLILHDLSLTGGQASHYGGAILNCGHVLLNNCNVYENNATVGGAIYSEGDLELILSALYDNTAVSSGGAIHNRGTGFIHASELYENTAVNGGAVHNDGNMDLLHATLYSNTADKRGGAIHNRGNMELLNTTLYGNTVLSLDYEDGGGAIYNEGATRNMKLDNSTLYDNTAVNGGAIYNDNRGNIELDYSSLYDNTAERHGGAIYNKGNMELLHSSLYGNAADQNGGAINNFGGDIAITNSTLSGNQAYEGSAIYSQDVSDSIISSLEVHYTTITRNSGGPALVKISRGIHTIKNSIIAENPYSDCSVAGVLDVLGTPNLDSDGSCPGFTITAPPLLDPLTDNGGATLTHALQFDSPARNAAAGDCPSEDQRNFFRPMGPACDLGSYEYPDPEEMTALEQEETITPEPLDMVTLEPAEEEPPPIIDWWWEFEGFVCSDSNLTEMYISTDADPELFSLTIDDHPVKCYQQSYDNTRYWCHVERVMLAWDTSTMINFCVGDVCQEIQQTTLSQAYCEGGGPVEEPENEETETQTCSSYDNVNTCTAAPGCMWFCANECSCVPEE
jgi:hypothetical protein